MYIDPEFIKQSARSVGFDACGIAAADRLDQDAAYLGKWLDQGCHADMNYLARNFEKRVDPRELVPGCKSVVVVLLNYYPVVEQLPAAPKIARYAWPATDYHVVIKSMLSELEKLVCTRYGSDVVSAGFQHSFVDSAPVLERRWAERAGLGWIGRHTQLISPGLGSYCFIGVLMLNAESGCDVPVRSRCGNCRRCIDACPTGALTDSGIDARRCISYLTIESKQPVPDEFRSRLNGCALGCDICAGVCPWNRKWARPHDHAGLAPVPEIANWDEKRWMDLTNLDFNRIFKKSAIKRAGYEKLKQNIETAIHGQNEKPTEK